MGVLAAMSIASVPVMSQQVTGQLQGILSFTVATIVFLVFGRLEAEVVRAQLARMTGETAPALLRAAIQSARKFRSSWPCPG